MESKHPHLDLVGASSERALELVSQLYASSEKGSHNASMRSLPLLMEHTNVVKLIWARAIEVASTPTFSKIERYKSQANEALIGAGDRHKELSHNHLPGDELDAFMMEFATLIECYCKLLDEPYTVQSANK